MYFKRPYSVWRFSKPSDQRLATNLYLHQPALEKRSGIVLLAAIIGAAVAQYDHGHGHGHAVSSQNVVLHQNHGYVQHAPVIAQHTPVIAHAPIVRQLSHYANEGHHVDYHAPAHYGFEYSVNDPHTGDIKSQHETREGDAVHGSYSLHEADGTVRRVDYTVDGHSGFNAVVHREGHAAHAAPAHQPAHHSYH